MKMTMNRRLAVRLCAVAVCSAALFTAPMLAQGGGGGRGRMDPQTQLNMMTDRLSLTADQQPKVLAILQDSQKKMMDLRNSGADPEDMRPKMMAIRQDQQDKVKALLTDDQKTKYDEMNQEMQNRMRGGPGGSGAPGTPDGGSAPPPPPPPQ